ncbi:MAG: hypothetical protein Q9177_002319 [Variospora cf. flavescens]
MEPSSTFTQAESSEGIHPVLPPLDLPAPANDSDTQQQSPRPPKRQLTPISRRDSMPSPKKPDRRGSSSISNLSPLSPSPIDEPLEPSAPASLTGNHNASNLSPSSSTPIDEPLEPDLPAKPLAEIREAHEKAGLEYPPPKYNLEGRWNTDKLTGVWVSPSTQPPKTHSQFADDSVHQRRYYSVKARKTLPFHHLPTVTIDRKTVSNSHFQVISHISDEVALLKKRHRHVGEDVKNEYNRLQQVGRFVTESVNLEDYNDKSGRNRSIEDRMEDLLVKYGYDKMQKPETSGSKGKGKGKEKEEDPGLS